MNPNQQTLRWNFDLLFFTYISFDLMFFTYIPADKYLLRCSKLHFPCRINAVARFASNLSCSSKGVVFFKLPKLSSNCRESWLKIKSLNVRTRWWFTYFFYAIVCCNFYPPTSLKYWVIFNVTFIFFIHIWNLFVDVETILFLIEFDITLLFIT